MARNTKGKVNRREFLKKSAFTAASIATGLSVKPSYAAKKSLSGAFKGKKVIILGFDGMDPGLTEKLMQEGKMPNLEKLRKTNGYRPLISSIPPQSPVAWANFINGAGPGSHGIFDFIHRNPEKQCFPFFAAAETVPGEGYWDVGDHKLQFDFWPFNHEPSATLLRRQGTPFWDYLDEAGISSTFYNLPSNYPPSPSKHGNHRCLAGMGTPDMTGSYGTYQHFAEDGPIRTRSEGGGKRSMIFFEDETSRPALQILGPANSFLKNPAPVTIDFLVHRDKKAKAAVIEIQEHKVVLKEKEWSRWLKLDFELSMPSFMPNEHISGICRFYLQEVGPNFRLYVTPINTDPSDPGAQITEPTSFIEDMSSDLGLFYTTGFQEDHKALSNGIFTDEEFATQSEYVLQERLNLLEYAVDNYDDGLLFFYFSSTDMQSHMFWWDSDDPHPTRSSREAKEYFGILKNVYRRMDKVVGDIIKQYGDDALVIVMSDHGFANFKRQFNLNTWLRDNKYIQSPDSTSILVDVDWSRTKAFGLGINGLYLNLNGREKYGIVDPNREREDLIKELAGRLEAVRDVNGNQVIRKVYRTDKSYTGNATKLAPDLIVGYSRGYRAAWATCLGDMGMQVLSDNDSAWSADHCADPAEVPGVLFSNRPIAAEYAALIDLAPSILTEFGLKIPSTMEGKNIFKT